MNPTEGLRGSALSPWQRALVETHLSRIRSLEQQLRQRDAGTFPGLGAPLPGQDVPFLALHPNPGLTHGELPPSPPHKTPNSGRVARAPCWGLSRALPAVLERAGGWQSRGLEATGRLEAELEAARQETQRAQHREEHLKAECERLQAELKHLQDTREQVRGRIRPYGTTTPFPTSPVGEGLGADGTSALPRTSRSGIWPG